jgi:glycosyltransferase involved in cell wall biosynthesis
VTASDLVIAGNDYLAVEARRWVGADRVTVIPTCVDVARYPNKNAGGTPALPGAQLVWVGSRSTLRGLERFAPTLSAIGQAVPGTRLKLVCDRFIDTPHLPVDQCVWNESTEPAELAAADVGIGWVPDDPWSRGKCGLKVLQYQAAGLPVVANAVGVQAEFVRTGETGFLANTQEEWVSAIRALASDAGLRHRLGAAARKQAEDRYSVEAGARLWLDALAGLSRESRKAG